MGAVYQILHRWEVGLRLPEVVASGALVLESEPFLANAVPSGGLMELVPLSGEGLTTGFGVNTFGWTDEEEHLLSHLDLKLLR